MQAWIWTHPAVISFTYTLSMIRGEGCHLCAVAFESTLEAEGVVELGFEAEAVLVAAGCLELEALALTPLHFP